jgi:predicted nucleotidyltransferase
MPTKTAMSICWWRPHRKPADSRWGALLMDAQDILGRPVDVVTVSSLHPLLRERILREARHCD